MKAKEKKSTSNPSPQWKLKTGVALVSAAIFGMGFAHKSSAALLGIASIPKGSPYITGMIGAYNQFNYVPTGPTTGLLTLNMSALNTNLVQLLPTTAVGTIQNPTLTINLTITRDANGNFVSVAGNPNGPDLIVTGTVSTASIVGQPYTGTLLTGEIVAFGFQDTANSLSDNLDFRFRLTTPGDLSDPAHTPIPNQSSGFTNKDLGMTLTIEQQTTLAWNGSWNNPFRALPKLGTLSPIPRPAISLVEKISVNGVGGTYFDADTATASDTPQVIFPHNAWYQLIITNTGTETLKNIQLEENTALGPSLVTIPGTLAPGASITVDAGSTALNAIFSQLYMAPRCTSAGSFENIGFVYAQGSTSNINVQDNNAANLICAGEPQIRLKKEISVDGGTTWADANNANDLDVPTGSIGSAALYRLTVTNTGGDTLTNVTVTDASLGLNNVSVPGGNMAPGDERILISTTAGFASLSQANRCAAPGDVVNTASVNGTGIISQQEVTSGDSAYLRCVAIGVEIKKEVSVDNGTHWFPADTSATAPTTTLNSPAQYRLIVTNKGGSTLTNATISDPALGLSNVAIPGGDLAPNETRTITSGSTGFSVLNQPTRCQSAGTFENIASISATDVSPQHIPVSDSNSAWVTCDGVPSISLKKEIRISIDNGASWTPWVASDSPGAPDEPVGPLGTRIEYRLIVENTGPETLVNPVINDPILGLVNVPVPGGNMLPLDIRTIYATDTGFAPLAQTNTNQPRTCTTIGEFGNPASVNAVGLTSNTPVSDSNPAYHQCVNVGINLKKQVSVDGTNWYDADTENGPDVPSAPLWTTVQYRLVVENVGSVPVSDLAISDAALGLSNVAVSGITSLAPGASHTILSSTPGFAALQQADRCSALGHVSNSATVSASTGVAIQPSISDTNLAWVSCTATCSLNVTTTCQVQPDGLAGNECTVDGLAADVNYFYDIQNTGDTQIVVNSVYDDRLGQNLPITPLTLAPHTHQAFNLFALTNNYAQLSATSTTTIVNQVTANAAVNVAGGPSCSSQSHARVNLVQPPPASIGDYVWKDLNNNGVNDGEPGIDGLKVYLYNCGGTTPITDTTTASGFYSFTNLAPGCYEVGFDTPIGTYNTPVTPNVGSNDTIDSDIDTGTLRTGPYNLSAGQNETSVDAGFKAGSTGQLPAAVGDRIWLDNNGDGKQTSGEPNATVSVGVELYNCASGVPTTQVGSTVTTSTGGYSFTGLAAGDYAIKFIAPTGYALTTPGTGTPSTVADDSDAGSNGFTACFTLTAGQTNNDVDAGLIKLASLGDFVWNDINQDGQQATSGEPGIPNVLVNLYRCDNLNTPADTTWTNTSGNYLFSNLLPGCYRVGFGTPTGYSRTDADIGPDATDSDMDETTGLTGSYNLAVGQDERTVDAGFYETPVPFEIGDLVWYDANQNGQQDNIGQPGGEVGIPNVEVKLYSCSDLVNPLGTTQTNANGLYKFTNLTPGCYQVAFATPTGYVRTTANVGPDGTDSDMSVTTGLTNQYNLAQTTLTIDAGFYKATDCVPNDDDDKSGDKYDDKDGDKSDDKDDDKDGDKSGDKDDDKDGDKSGDKDDDKDGDKSGDKDDDKDGDKSGGGGSAGDPCNPDPCGSGGGSGDKDDDKYGDKSGDKDDDKDGDKSGDKDDDKDGDKSGDKDDDKDGDKSGDKYDDKDGDKSGDKDDDKDGDKSGNGSSGECNPCPSGGGSGDKSDDKSGDKYGDKDDDKSGDKYGDKDDDKSGDKYGDKDDDKSGDKYGDKDDDKSGDKYDDKDGDKSGGSCNPPPPPATAKLGDKVWNDVNRNGQQDGTEPGIPNVPVALYSCGSTTALRTVTTNSNGGYEFANLTAGCYQVGFGTLAGYARTTADASGVVDTLDSDMSVSTGLTANITLATGETNLSVDAGFYTLPANLGNRVWFDTNNNGIQDSGEGNAANVGVDLYACQSGIPATRLTGTTTNTSGIYSFTGLVAGSYAVKFNAPTNYQFSTTVGAGSDRDKDSNAGVEGFTSCVTLAPGETNNTVDAGLVLATASLGDFVWNDLDKDGRQDSGEPGIMGVNVNLHSCGSALALRTTTTGNDGKYSFTRLVAGCYEVSFATPTGFIRTSANIGSNDSIDSDMGSTTGRTGSYNLAAGASNTSVDAGFYSTACGTGSISPRTIGYWRNYASCSGANGNQGAILDQNLAKSAPTGVPVGALFLQGSTTNPNVAPDCLKAVRLISKSSIDTGANRASNPAFNMAAQYVAARVNVLNGAKTCGTLLNSLNQAQNLLASVNFNGITHSTLSNTQSSTANSLATTLDNYNNGNLCK